MEGTEKTSRFPELAAAPRDVKAYFGVMNLQSEASRTSGIITSVPPIAPVRPDPQHEFDYAAA